MKKIVYIISGLLMGLSASATTYYASPTGKGNGTSYASPCSFGDGLQKLTNGGDTLYLLGGQYDLLTTTFNKSGNQNANIVISGYPGEKAILDFRNTEYGKRGLQIANSCTYVHVKDLTLRYSGKNNLYNEGSYCTFENLDIYGSSDTGCQMKNGGNNLIKNVDSHDNFDYKLDKSGNLTQVDFGGNADGFADKQFTGAGNHYVGCRAWNNSDDGWDFFQRVSTSPTIIEYSVCYKNGPREYDMRNHPRYQTDKAWFDQFKTPITVTNADGKQVTVSLQHYVNEGNGNGFKLGGALTQHDVEIHHCLSVANTVKGFDQNSDAGTMRVYNNTGYLNGSDYGFYNTKGGTLYIQNCVSYKSLGSNSLSVQTVAANDHNTWNNKTCAAADFVSLDTTEILMPRLADGEMRLWRGDAPNGNTLMHLAKGSQLIDAGVQLSYTFYGQAPDLGCFEVGGVVRPSLRIVSNATQSVKAGAAIAPIVFAWDGPGSTPTYSLPAGLQSAVNTASKTITVTGAIAQAGTYTVTVSTAADSLNVQQTATIVVKPANYRQVAYVTTPGSASDMPLLEWLMACDSVMITETDAADATTDYAEYDLLILGPQPSSKAAGFGALKGIDKPMIVLKPWLFKQGVWSWGTAINTADLGVQVPDTTHPIFSGLGLEDGTLPLFESCNTNAVTAISAWDNCTGVQTLASPLSQPTASAIAEMQAGAELNGTTLTQPLLMIGVSEYSTADLTEQGRKLIAHAMYYMLGMQAKEPGEEEEPVGIFTPNAASAQKMLRDGQLLIVTPAGMFDTMGRRVK